MVLQLMSAILHLQQLHCSADVKSAVSLDALAAARIVVIIVSLVFISLSGGEEHREKTAAGTREREREKKR